MFAGHLGAALAAKTVEPDAPLGAAVGAAFGIDLLWPVLLLLGVESVRVNPGDTAFTHLAFDSYPWSHSLAAVLAWSALAAAAARALRLSWRTSGVLGLLVLSHWVLDFVTHRPDLPLWPGGPLVGLGLWNSIPATMVVESGLLAAGLVLYLGKTRAVDRTGWLSLAALVALVAVIWATQPWAPPPPSAAAVAWVGLATWLLPPWGQWIERHRRVREPA